MASILLYSCGGGSGDPTPAATVATQKENVNVWLRMTKNEAIQVADLRLFRKTFEGGVTFKDDTTRASVFDFTLTPISGNTQAFIFKELPTNYAFKFEAFTKDSLISIVGTTNYLLLKSGYKEVNTPLTIKIIKN